ncbi:DUF4387 domain-containing protein [Desulfovibrio sp. OttesenSCG-928-G11]|nr:DUF4387 domain-containing protein [Desulfovibrio sp. OttesenSCG-928-G11]
MDYPLRDLASVIRSKNSGPFELTFDIIFKDFETYEKVKAARAIAEKDFAALYGISEADIIKLVYFDPAKAVKITIVRPLASGALGESDVYGAQQHSPLITMTVRL